MTADDIGRAKGEGIAAIINNRPDGEEGQPAAADIRKAAEAAGLGHSSSGRVRPDGEDEVRAFQKAVAAAFGPVLAHCRSGTRSLTLHVLGEVLDGRMKKDEVILLRSARLRSSGAAKWSRPTATDFSTAGRRGIHP